MIEVGQLRRWTCAGRESGMLFLVLEHSPFPLTGVGMDDDGWIIMEPEREPFWEETEHIEESSETVQR